MNTVTDFNAKTPGREDAEKIENVLAALIVDAAIEVRGTLGGPGLLESLYEEAPYQELKLRNVSVQTQVQIPVTYKAQVLTYLRLTKLKLGLLLNFGQKFLCNGIERVVNDL